MALATTAFVRNDRAGGQHNHSSLYSYSENLRSQLDRSEPVRVINVALVKGILLRILFAQENYPAQFGEFASCLSAAGWVMRFLTAGPVLIPLPYTKFVWMTPHHSATQGAHCFALSLEKAMINGKAFANTAIALREDGFTPDNLFAHSGSWSGTFAKVLWPN